MYVMFLPSVGDVCHVFAISWRCISCVMSTFGALIVTSVLEVFDVFHLSWYRLMRLPFGGISTVVVYSLYPLLYFPTVSGWELCRDGQLTVCPFLQWKCNSVTGFFHRFMQSDFNHFCSWAAFVVFVWRCNDSFSKDMNHSVADSALIWTILSAIFSGNPDLCHKNGEFVSIKVVYSRIVSQPILN